ncbi:hypothetical protein Tco_0932759 [Tanacetum coccineum]
MILNQKGHKDCSDKRSLQPARTWENISKIPSAIPHDSPPRVTSLGGDEGSLQQKLNELMEICTTLQSQHTQMAAKIQSQDLEISQLKTRIKALENAQNIRGDVQEDAPNRGGSMDQREEFGIERDSNKSTKKGNESTEEMANVLSSMGAANILASGGLKEVVTTASPQVATTSLQVAPASTTDTPVALASVIDTPVVATASDVRGIYIESRSQEGLDFGSESFSSLAQPTKLYILRVSREGKGKRLQRDAEETAARRADHFTSKVCQRGSDGQPEDLLNIQYLRLSAAGRHSVMWLDDDIGQVQVVDPELRDSTIPTLRIQKNHPKGQILRDLKSAVQIRGKIQKASSAQQALFKLQKVWILVDLPSGKKAIGTKWVFKNKGMREVLL